MPIRRGICLALAFIWLRVPQFLLWIWRIDGPGPALLVARRGGALFLGVGAMLFLARDAETPPAAMRSPWASPSAA